MKPLIPSFIHEQLLNKNTHGIFKATTLYIDISGFTPLTESLLKHGRRGAEVLSEILDDIFIPITTLVYDRGGIIPYFAGDAFVAIFENEQAVEVADIAFQIKKGFDKNAVFATHLGQYSVSLRLGMSYGFVEWGIVGADEKTFYFKGTAIERAILAQQKAEPGHVVFDEWFKEIFFTSNNTEVDIEVLHESFYILNNFKINYDKEEFLKQVTYSESDLLTTPSVIKAFKPLEYTILKQFLPDSVISFNQKGEFREAISVFMSFDNVNNFDDLNTVSKIVLKHFKTYEGYFKEIDYGDKGCMMVGFFGAPTAFENQTTRALECVLAIKEDILALQKTRPFKMRIGITSGIAYSGIIGCKDRCQYAIVGDNVNLAARIMQNGQWNDILTDRNLSTTTYFTFEEQGVINYKGISNKIAVFKLTGKNTSEKVSFAGDLVGRQEELQQLIQLITNAFDGDNYKISCIYGEAGIGKSRLVHEVKSNLSHGLKLQWATCPADQILRKPFNPFVYFLKNYFNQNIHKTVLENKQAFEKTFNNLIKSLPKQYFTEGVELQRTQSVLAALLDLSYPESLWEQLDARGRYENTLMTLQNTFMALAYTQPLVIELEDAHWLDSDSKRFLDHFIKKIKDLPIAIIATFRYNDDGSKPMPFPFDPNMMVCEIDLNAFTPDDLVLLTNYKLQGGIHPELLDLLWRTGNGNAFYTEQILDYLKENNLLQFKDAAWTVKDTQISITPSVSTILTARIDRLSSILKETIKAAAVIGREFDIPILAEVMLSNEEYIRLNGNGKLMLKEQVQTAERSQIWRAMTELHYIFHHTLLRETVYDMQLKTRLRELHELTACAIEKLYADKLKEKYIDLAFHFERAENHVKAKEYMKKAADNARQAYQNQQALDLYSRLLKIEKDENKLVKIWTTLGEINQLIGQWKTAMDCFNEAINIANSVHDDSLKGHTLNAMGTLLTLRGDYPEARPYLEKATAFLEQSVDNQGIVVAYGSLGNLYFRQGQYDLAKDYFERSLTIARENQLNVSPQMVANLGLTYMNQGNFTEGVNCLENELAFYEAENELLGKAILYVNLGIIWFERGNNDAATDCLEKGLKFSQELGNKLLISIALGSLGQVFLGKNDNENAAKYINQDFDLVNELGDKQGMAIVLELRGKLFIENNDIDNAESDFQQSLEYSERINYPKGRAKALQGLGEVAFLKENFTNALHHFDEAIALCRSINNKIVLGYCLKLKIKTMSQMEQNCTEEQQELNEIIDFLGSERLDKFCEQPELNVN